MQVYTGNGKGKTTAALGLAFRAAGAGLKVYFAQFLKAKHSSEHIALERYSDLITATCFGSNNFIMDKPSPEDVSKAMIGIDNVRNVILEGYHDLVILDEFMYVINLKIISLQDAMTLIKSKPRHVELVLTGRDAPAQIVQVADLVTEMMKVKHYYDTGTSARIGIEL
jgi:cob(I)alamin adenosyltransferase